MKNQWLATITTHLGLYQYTRLPFGVAQRLGFFSRLLARCLTGILDDIIVTGENVEQTLEKFEEGGA